MPTSPVLIKLALNQPGSDIAAAINALGLRLDSVETRLTTNEASIASLQGQINTHSSQIAVIDAKVTDLINRMARLESLLLFPGPEVGVTVHLKNGDGDCVPAVIYEDPTKRNDPETVSVMYVNPDNPIWVQRADVRSQDGLVNDTPFNYWHQPEFTFAP